MPRLVSVLVVMLLVAGLAQAADLAELEHKARAAFALGRYAEAGESYEKAFEIRSDAALLYNAAQSYRLAGNKERALLLYQNYLRVFGDQQKRAEIQRRIDELTAAIGHDKAVATSPSKTPAVRGRGVTRNARRARCSPSASCAIRPRPRAPPARPAPPARFS